MFRVSYTYLSERSFLPAQYVMEEVDFREGLLRHTNYLDKIEFGLDPSAPDGYFPEMLRKRTDPWERFTITSNGVLHQIIARGDWAWAVAGTDEPVPDPLAWQTWPRWVLLAVAAVGRRSCSGAWGNLGDPESTAPEAARSFTAPRSLAASPLGRRPLDTPIAWIKWNQWRNLGVIQCDRCSCWPPWFCCSWARPNSN